MPRYVFRVLRQVAVFEVVGQDRQMDCENDSQAHIEAVKLAAEEFPGKVDFTVEFEKLKVEGAQTTMTTGDGSPPSGHRPKETTYGSPF